MKPGPEVIEFLRSELTSEAAKRVNATARAVVAAKERGGKVVVVVGSGPNVHEGVTTLLAELIRLGVVDGITTSSAVVAHEMGGSLERVKRVPGKLVGIDQALLPKDGMFELSLLPKEQMEAIRAEMLVDEGLIGRMQECSEGSVIIKAAGNLSYPLGLRTERLAREAEQIAKAEGSTVEAIAGRGADPMTMIGAGARAGKPVLVCVPQLVGGGAVGLAIGDAIPITRRSALVAAMLADADVIIESAVALTQEIHDGPFERYTGHGLWAAWDGLETWSLEGKTLVRIDLDPALERAWKQERENSLVQEAIAKGMPKTKVAGVPFRMEMSGFCRLEGSIPIIADIGTVWPVLADEIATGLGLELGFNCCRQDLPAGQAMRERIVREVQPVDRALMQGL